LLAAPPCDQPLPRGWSPHSSGPSTPEGNTHTGTVRPPPRGRPPVAGPSNLASGATASSKGTQPVCRLPLAAFTLLTSDVKSWRPAAVMQYGDQGRGAQCPCRPFGGASDHHHRCVVHAVRSRVPSFSEQGSHVRLWGAAWAFLSFIVASFPFHLHRACWGGPLCCCHAQQQPAQASR